MLRPVLPAVRPFRSGAICLFLAVTLALSAGTLGVGPDGARPDWWDAEWVKTRGGMVGETLDWGVETLLGARRRAHPRDLPVHRGRAAAHRRVRRERDQVHVGLGVLDDARAAHGRREGAAPRPPPRVRGRSGDAGALHARARRQAPPAEIEEPPEYDALWDSEIEDRRRAAPSTSPSPSRSASSSRSRRSREPSPTPSPRSREVPELERLAEDPDEDEPASRAARPSRSTPSSSRRRAATAPEVTDSPDFVWELPDAARRSRARPRTQSRPDTAGQEKVAAQLLEALGHFNIEARVIGMVAGPHITRYELRLAPGIKVGKVAQLKDDLAYALAAADIRILAPIPGKQAVGIEVPERAPPDRAPRRHLPGAARRTGRR